MTTLTCLSISEDAGVVPLEGIVQDVPAEALEHCLLRGEVRQTSVQRVEAVVERERLWLFPGTTTENITSQVNISKSICSLTKLYVAIVSTSRSCR